MMLVFKKRAIEMEEKDLGRGRCFSPGSFIGFPEWKQEESTGREHRSTEQGAYSESFSHRCTGKA